MTRLQRIIEEIGRLLPAETRWHRTRLQRLARSDPFTLLVQAVISHQTTIAVEDRAIARIRKRFRTPFELARARYAEVDRLISDVNYHPTKARRLMMIAQEIVNRWNGSLDFLHHLSLKRSLEELTSLPGVGRKTAAVVLLSVFGKPIFPVDTNILRVAKELELVPRTASAESTSRQLATMLPRDPEAIKRAHAHLLALGRATSRGRNRDLIRRLRAIR